MVLADLEPNQTLFEKRYENQSLMDDIRPNLHRSFGKGEAIVVYFEIYNILLNAESRSDLSVTLGVSQQIEPPPQSGISALFHRQRKPVTVSIEQNIDSTRETEYVLHSVVLPEYRRGKYTLTIKVRDKNVRTTAKKSVDFEIR